MIYNNVNYGNVPNVTVAEFGGGTISITNGANKDHKGLFMKTIEKHTIGEILGNNMSSDEFKPELAIVFTNKESFDVFYEYVQNIKEQFNSIDQ